MSEFSDLSLAEAAEERHPTNGASYNGASHAYGTAAPTPDAAERAEQEGGEPAPRNTWGPNPPPLRMSRVGVDPEERLQAATVPPAPAYDLSRPSPGLLRACRIAAGVLLLLLAWGLTVAVIALTRLLLAGLPVTADLAGLGLYLLEAVSALWLAVVALACVIAAAFALSLGITRHGW